MNFANETDLELKGNISVLQNEVQLRERVLNMINAGTSFGWTKTRRSNLAKAVKDLRSQVQLSPEEENGLVEVLVGIL